VVSTDRPPALRKQQEHSIDLLVYWGPLGALERATFDRALSWGRGQIAYSPLKRNAAQRARTSSGRPPAFDADTEHLLSTVRACASCGSALPELDPRWFSFNTRQGRCAACQGTGIFGGPEAIAEAEPDEQLEACPACGGSRLAPIPRAVRLAGERYHELTARSVRSLLRRLPSFRFGGERARIARAPLQELGRRLHFVDQVGLGYLGLDRSAQTLSGGEMQRLRLAAQLGSGLTGALYVLDEPTIGLHPRDTGRLLQNLRALVDMGSTVVVVEHDADTIRAADYLVDLGPAGGRGGGRVMAAGPPAEVLSSPESPTARALGGEQELGSCRQRVKPASERIALYGARANNLRIDELAIPTGCMCVVAGVSGSGKSTLVRQVLYPAARRALGRVAAPPGAHASLRLPSAIARALSVDQSPIGRTPRSVPATFLGIWDDIRRLFAATPEARARGYKPARFSFNSARGGGRCEACRGNGLISHEMAFLPDVKTRCEACGGLRFEPATLDIQYLGLSIGEVLRLTVEEALELFRAHPRIVRPLQTLCDLGVGYVALGQASPTLSGGEAQRLKLAVELTAGGQHRPTLYVLDEPTTGLHHSDVRRLIQVLDRLVTRGDSLVVIEHHPAVIAAADHVIELGPEGGEEGGRVIAQGTPAELRQADTATAEVLRRLAGGGAAVSRSGQAASC